MQRTLISPPADPPMVESGSAFNVLIAYEDFQTGKLAKMTCDALAANLSRECCLSSQMWKFEVLSIPKLREIAVQDAANADIIMISCRGEQLGQVVIQWIESWLKQGTNALGLVALIAPPEDLRGIIDVSGVKRYLADAARRGKLAFFSQPDFWPGDDLPSTFAKPGTSRNGLASDSAPSVTLREPTPRWGINE